MKKTTYNKIICTIFSVSVILIFFIASIKFWSTNLNFYYNEHSKIKLDGLKVADYIGISDEDLIDLTSKTISYLDDLDATLDIEFKIKGEERQVFSDEEKVHMEDVRIFNVACTIVFLFLAIICFLSSVLFKTKNIDINDVYVYYTKTLIFFGVLFSLIFIFAILDFDSFWNLFHEIIFSNKLWILDIRKDVLAMLLPNILFKHLFFRVLLTFILGVGIIWVVFYFRRRKFNSL